MAIEFTTTTSDNPNSGVQLTYPLRLTAGQEGYLSDLAPVLSTTYYNTSGSPLAFGTLVALNTNPANGDPKGIAPFLASTVTDPRAAVGLLVAANTFEGATGSAYQARDGYYPNPSVLKDGRLGYPDGQACNVLYNGVAWVYTTDVTTKEDDDVRFYIEEVADKPGLVGGFLGRFCITAIPGKTVKVLKGARWATGSNNGNLAQLRITGEIFEFQAD